MNFKLTINFDAQKKHLKSYKEGNLNLLMTNLP